MLESLGIILITGIVLGSLSKKLTLPPLVGMLVGGIIIGPYVLNLIDSSILDISADIRKVALIIILTRAGLSLDLSDLKKVGRPIFLMCFVPACFEMIGMMLLAPKLLGLSVLEAAILGSVVAAVSPAVVVPSMIKLIDEGYGTKKGIPQLILAGASVDDVFVIVMFTTFTSLAIGNDISYVSFINIPVSIILGILIGFIVGRILTFIFKKFNVDTITSVLIMLSISFILIWCEELMPSNFNFSSLISIMIMGISIRQCELDLSNKLSIPFNKLWIGGQIMLFILVGASVDIRYALDAGFVSVILIVGVLLFRIVGVLVCLIKTHLNRNERLFCCVSYMPKATVQAAIGGLPLAMGLACGNIVLTVAVVSILLTAPIGALVIDKSYKKLLKQ